MATAHTSTRKLKIGTSLQTPRTALMIAGMIRCFGLLSFCSYQLHSQVKRGENSAERSARVSMWSATAACDAALGRQALKMARCLQAPARAHPHAANALVLSPLLLRG